MQVLSQALRKVGKGTTETMSFRRPQKNRRDGAGVVVWEMTCFLGFRVGQIAAVSISIYDEEIHASGPSANIEAT